MIILLIGLADGVSTVIDTFNTFQYFRPFISVFSWMMKTHVHIGLLDFTWMDLFVYTGLGTWLMWLAGYFLDIWKK